MSTPRLGKFIVYFNGIEIPAAQVDVRLGAKAIPSASIVVAPDRELLRLGKEDRLHVAVFYLDDVYATSSNKDPQYRMLFEGEITGWSYESQAGSRAISFQATGLADILQRIAPNIMTNLSQLAQGTVAGGAQGSKSPIPEQLFPAALFFQGLGLNLKKGEERKPITRPYDFVENIFKGLFGNAEFQKYNSSPAAHFFARWARRTNFINRWSPSPYIEGEDMATTNVFPMLKALQQNFALDVMKQQAQQVDQESMLSLLYCMLQPMYYEITALPNMPAVKYDLKTHRVLGPPVFTGTPEENAPGRGSAQPPMTPVRILNHVTKPELTFCAVPRCNIIFPSMTNGYVFSEDYAHQITRLYVYDNSRYALVAPNSTAHWSSELLRSGYPNKVRAFLRTGDKNRAFNDHNFLIFPEEYYRGPVTHSVEAPSWFHLLANAVAAKANAAAGEDPAKGTAGVEATRSLYDIYSAYEYTRARMSTRNGSVSMRFNPYVAPGFPGVILDREDTGVHVYCYIQNVSHSLGPNGFSTTVNYAFAQTFDEFFETYVNQLFGAENLFDQTQLQAALATLKVATEEFAAVNAGQAGQAWPVSPAYAKARAALSAAEAKVSTFAPVPDMAPAHPIPDIRARFQTFDKAREYYTMLFQQGVATEHDAVFDWRQAVGVLNPDDPKADPEPIKITAPASGATTVVTNAVQSAGAGYGLRGVYRTYAEDERLALEYVSRPIVSLEEFIDFHGDYAVRGDRVSDDGPAPYYLKILDLTQGPGEAPVDDQYGYPTSMVTEDTRDDWESRLETYRKKVKSSTFFTA